MKNYTKIIAAVAAGLACTAVTSQASISPGTFGVNIGSSSEAAPGAGTQVGSSLVEPYTISSITPPVTDTGVFTSAVYKGNSFGANDLSFVFTLTISAGDAGSITVNGFSGLVNAENVTGSPDFSNTVNFDPAGFLKFIWNTPVAVGQTVSVIVDTSSTVYGPSVGSVQDGLTANVPTLAPVPEPTTVVAGALMLLPFGIGALRSLRKDRIA